MLTHLAKVFKEKEQIIEIFLENILFLFKSAKNQKLILNTNTKEMELLKFYLNYVESKFFKTLLEIVKDDKKLHEDLKLIFDNNIKNEKLNIINKFQEID
jgi:hypothetical protein